MYDVVGLDLPALERGATYVLGVDSEFGATPFYGYRVGDVEIVPVDSATTLGFAQGFDHPHAVADANLGDAQVLEFTGGVEDCGVDEEACVLDPEVMKDVDTGASVVEATYAVAGCFCWACFAAVYCCWIIIDDARCAGFFHFGSMMVLPA